MISALRAGPSCAAVAILPRNWGGATAARVLPPVLKLVCERPGGYAFPALFFRFCAAVRAQSASMESPQMPMDTAVPVNTPR